MKIIRYKQHSIAFEEAGVVFEHDFEKSSNTYFNDKDETTLLLNSLTTEKVKDFFKQDEVQHLALYQNLYEVSTSNGLVYLYDPVGKLLFLREKNDLACSEISMHSEIYSIFIEKLQQLLCNVTISVHDSIYDPEEAFEEYF